jgi:hypothetical protein
MYPKKRCFWWPTILRLGVLPLVSSLMLVLMVVGVTWGRILHASATGNTISHVGQVSHIIHTDGPDISHRCEEHRFPFIIDVMRLYIHTISKYDRGGFSRDWRPVNEWAFGAWNLNTSNRQILLPLLPTPALWAAAGLVMAIHIAISQIRYNKRLRRKQNKCSHCGYLLHGLPFTTSCPECGVASARITK